MIEHAAPSPTLRATPWKQGVRSTESPAMISVAPLIPSLRDREDYQTSLVYIMSSRTATTTQVRPRLKKENSKPSVSGTRPTEYLAPSSPYVKASISDADQ